MKLKSTISLIVIVLLLGSVIGIAATGVEDKYEMDTRYWWEVECTECAECLPPYQREIVRDTMIQIFNTYFGIDISRMSLEELDAAINEVGEEKVHSLLRYYVRKKGIEILESPELPPAPLPIEPVYWWEITCSQGVMRATIYLVKGMCRNEVEAMCPSEVEKRFQELFPGVDPWKMTLDEFDLFLSNLPQVRAPLKPVCFEELKDNPYIIARFGKVPPFSTEEEMEKFTEKLEKVMEAASPLLRELPRCEFPFEGMVAHRGAISVSVRRNELPQAEVVYEILAEKAEKLFGIKDVPVTFNKCYGGRLIDCQIYLSSSPSWRPPWNEPFHPIPGAVKVTSPYHSASTASFAVRRLICRWRWIWDNDFIITGHKGPGGTIPPVNMRIYQPTAPHGAGSVAANVGRRSHADAARVGICDTRVRPYILIGGTSSRPTLRPVFASRDPIVGERIWISAGRTGRIWQVRVERTRVNIPNWPPFDMNYNQVLVRPLPGNPWPIRGDSGSPLWSIDLDRPHGVEINGLLVGIKTINGRIYMVMSPVSGVEREFPGWRVWYR